MGLPDRSETGPNVTLAPLAPAHFICLGAFQAAAVLLFIDPIYSAIPLALFVLISGLAPFFPGWRYFMPTITHGKRSEPTVALTFDDGPDPLLTPLVLDLLAERGIRAAFFLIGKKIEQHPELVRRIIAEGHEIGTHSYSHDVFLMLRSHRAIEDEVARGAGAAAELGLRPLAFRPPVGIVNPRLWPPLLRRGMFCVGFSLRPRDLGNRRTSGLGRRIADRVKNGDIILLHDSAPADNFDSEAWLAEIEKALDGIAAKGIAVASLSRLIGRAVCELGDKPVGPVDSFYDALAPEYDAEQAAPAFSGLRGLERKMVEARLAELVGPKTRALEIGAGAGAFTIGIAEAAASVTAVDISAGMLEVLDKKAERLGLGNIKTIAGDARALDISGPYDLIVSFSAFEYIPDLGALIKKLAERLTPGGRLYFTTARRSFFRFWAQIGNAMRQGLWLHARSKKELTQMFAEAGLETESITSAGFKTPVSAGVLIEAIARKPE